MSLLFCFGMFVVRVFLLLLGGCVLVFFKDIKELMPHYMLQYLFIIAQIRIWKLLLNTRSVFERVCQALDLTLTEVLSCCFSDLQFSMATVKMSTNKKLIMQANFMYLMHKHQKTSHLLLPFSCECNNSRRYFPISLLFFTWPTAMLCGALYIFCP